ncbi:MAG: sigma-70 family RNA polymerase sigma factor [Oscillospiraceae bacterium]|jgi:RNA polymerase sigma-70 factor (ECF subfamily)|nr:sigma-70 family RNA polymerase sigma factor [Oscillospiraceae bacterium]
MDNFEEVMRKYSDTVYRIAFVRTGNSHDAEDITQDVFLSYIRAGKTYADEEHRKAWLIRAAVNASINTVRSAWKRHSGGQLNENEGRTDENFHRIETRSVVYSAVLKLPEKYRTVVHLFYYEDMTLAQISQLTKTRENTVKSRLRRAKDILREKLEGVDFDV